MISAFLDKIRNEYRTGRSILDAQAYTEKIELGNEVARFLTQNLVQGEKTEEDIWRKLSLLARRFYCCSKALQG